MNKLLGFMACAVCMMFTGCGGDDDVDNDLIIDGEPATVFTAAFLDAYPEDNIVEDNIYGTDIYNQLNKIVPYTTTAETESQTVDKIDHYVTTYTLLFATRSARMTVKTETLKKSVKNEYKITSYKYRPGRYYFPDYESDTWDLVFDVTDNAVHFGYVMKNSGEPTQSYRQLCELTGGCRKTSSLVNSSEAEAEPSVEEYTGMFNVVTEVTGMSTLKNSDYTYNFHPSTGMLTRLAPDYTEIGTLDRQVY